MCRYCRRSICPSNCPSAPEPPIYGRCEVCYEKIYDGDEYYKIGEHTFCASCVHEGYRTAEVEQEDYL